jgi:hypothetical protein
MLKSGNAYEFYNGTDVGEEFKYLQTAEDGDALPARWINFNKIKVKIDVLLGELTSKGYEIDVSATNKAAVSRKLKRKNEMLVDVRMREVFETFEEAYGMPIRMDRNLPDNEHDVEAYFNYSYKEKSEIIMRSALKYVAKKMNWDYERLAMFRDLLICGRVVAKSEIKRGLPYVRRIDPRNFVFDRYATDDYLTDATFMGEVHYYGIGDAAEKYGLTRKQIEDVYRNYKASRGRNLQPQRDYTGYFRDADGISFFKEERGELRVLVFEAVWEDFKTMKKKYSTDKYGDLHIKSIKDGETGKDIKSANYRIWRHGVLVGGELLQEYGEVKNMTRSVDDPYDTPSPYFGMIPNYINGRGVSKVMQMMGIQKLIDMTMYNMQLAMARAGTKVLLYDISQLPDQYSFETMIKYMKSVGIAPIDSAKDGMPSNFNQFREIDMTLSDSVRQYLEIVGHLDDQLNQVTGVSSARQGQQQYATTAVGVHQQSMIQSHMATQTLFDEFAKLSTMIFTHQAGLIKYAWADNERFAPIIGETGIDFLAEDIDLDLDDYGAFIEIVPPMIDDITMFHELVVASLQAGAMGEPGRAFLNAIKILREKDIDVAIEKYERSIIDAEKAAEAKEQLMQQMQAEQQAERDERAEEARAKNAFAMQQMAKAVQESKDKGKERQIALETRGDLFKERLKQEAK